MVNKSLKWVGWIVLILVSLITIFLIYVTAVDYKPPVQLELQTDNNNDKKLKPGEPFTITTFNIGYAGLDQGQDFFMDGGTMSRSSSKKQTEVNLASMGAILKKIESDIYLLQEVDKDSSRSYHINVADKLGHILPDYSRTFALNYKVPWVPVPVLHPMGSVESGLLTLSTYQSTSNTRFDLPGKERWPVQPMELDRAFISSRFPVDNGKEMVLVNLHLSAFDKAGKIRKQQLEFLERHIGQEMKKGNYLILGGDWNYSLPGTDPTYFDTKQARPEWLQEFPDTFNAKGFQWANDPMTPTVRTLDIPYQKGVNFLAVIDGFLVSPNIEVLEVKGHDFSFKSSDHNPVTGSFKLK